METSLRAEWNRKPKHAKEHIMKDFIRCFAEKF